MIGVLWRILAILGVLAVAFGVLWYTGLLVPLNSAGGSSMAPTIPACDGRTIAEGFTYKQIGRTCGIAPGTVGVMLSTFREVEL